MVLTLLSTVAWPADPDDAVEEVVVETERPVDTATERTLDREAIEAFPARSADDLLRAMPGLHLSAHGGHGKAFQILVRGFDAEHGSDVLVHVAGVPMNEPSNVHGQGYLDLHFLPTLLVSDLSLVKGSYRAEDGDFATTGTADYGVGLSDVGLQMAARAGTDHTAGATVAWRPAGRGPGSFVVAETEGGQGVGEGRAYGQVRVAGGLDGRIGDTDARVAAFVYDGRFDSPGVLREDDLEDGEIGFYDAYPVANGGSSRRAWGFGALAWQRDAWSAKALAWGGGRGLTLDQDFSGWLRDEVHGDGTRQDEVAADTGARGEVGRVLDVFGQTWGLRGGADVRFATVAATEQGITPDGVVWEDRLDSESRHLDTGLWAEGRIVAGPVFTLVPALRVDRIALSLRDHLDATFTPIVDPEWAHSAATVVAPKGTASVHVVDPLTLFVAAGRGFRSPEARGIADGDLAPVVTSDSAEGGARFTPAPSLAISATAFRIVISNELVFDHLAGRFLSEGRTQRLGVEGVVDVRPSEWLHLQGDATWTDGRFTATDEPIPYAPRLLVTGGAFLEGAHVAGGHLTGGIRAWALGPRPLPSGFASKPAVVGSLTSRLELERWSIGLDVDNLFVGHWRDGEWVYPSWFDKTEPRSELKELHVTAGDPFAARVELGLHW